LGVAILGSLLAVIFRNQLGVDRPAELAATLDQPAAVVSQLPASARVATHVNKDASESIGGALEFAGKAGGALQQRASQPAGAAATPEQIGALRAQAQSAIGGFVDDSKNSFVVAMRVTSAVAGGFALIGSVVAFTLLPGRREFAEYAASGTTARAADEPALAH
jgi:DHA2 family integral membrane protein (MFS transporter)